MVEILINLLDELDQAAAIVSAKRSAEAADGNLREVATPTGNVNIIRDGRKLTNAVLGVRAFY